MTLSVELIRKLRQENKDASSYTELWNKSVELLEFASLDNFERQSLYNWVFDKGILVDHKPLDFDYHKYLIDIYQDDSPDLVIASAAQVGKTIYEALKITYNTIRYTPSKWGFYFPTQKELQKLVQDRFDPLMGSIPGISEIYERGRTKTGKKFADNTVIKQIFESTIYFLWMGGLVTKDSTPLDGIVVDEVRLMLLNEIEQIEKRLLHSELKHRTFTSTYGFPGDAIDILFKRSKQYEFHNKCQCKEGVVLTEHFPNCIGERTNPKPNQEKYFYRCPVCDTEIKDNQEGEWIAHNPEADMAGYHPHGLLVHKKYKTPKQVWDKLHNSQNIKEFYNSDVGLPYIDKESQGLTPDILASCINNELQWETSGTRSIMGIDQMGGFNHVVVKKLTEDNLFQTVHLEIIYDDNPFSRCANLMNIFDVNICVTEQLPNYNDALRFAKAFPSRVFIVSGYNALPAKFIVWLDRDQLPVEQRKTQQDLKFKYMVSLNHFKIYDWSFKLWKDRVCRVPNPMRLIQSIKVKDIPPELREKFYKGKILEDMVPAALCKDIYFDHLCRKVKLKKEIMIKDPVTGQEMPTGEYNWYWVNRGIDPHFASADMLCNVAMARIRPPKYIEEI